MKYFDSDVVKSISWDNGTLTVYFYRRTTARFFNVPLSVAKEFENASSAGSYYYEYIHNKYKWEFA